MIRIKQERKGPILLPSQNSAQRQSSAVSVGRTLEEFSVLPLKKQTISMDSTPTTSRPSTTATTTRLPSSIAITRAVTQGRHQYNPDLFNRSHDKLISGIHLGGSSTQPPTPIGQRAQNPQSFHQHYGDEDSLLLHGKNDNNQKKVELNHKQRPWTEQGIRRINGINEKNQNILRQRHFDFNEGRNSDHPGIQITLPFNRDIINQIHQKTFLPKTMKNVDTQDHQETNIKQFSSSPRGDNIEMSVRSTQYQNDILPDNPTNPYQQEKNQILFKIRRRHSINGEEKSRLSPFNIQKLLNVNITTKDQQRDQSNSFSDINSAQMEEFDVTKAAAAAAVTSRKSKKSLERESETVNNEKTFSRKNDKQHDCFLDSFLANQKQQTHNFTINKRNLKQNEWLQAELMNIVPDKSKRVNSANGYKKTRQLSPAFGRKIIPQDYTFQVISQTTCVGMSQKAKLNYIVEPLQPYNSQQDNKFMRSYSSSVHQRENTSNIRQELRDLDEFSARIKAEKKFNKQLSKMKHTSKGFCGITMQENSLLNTVEGFKRVKAKKYEPSYPFCLSFDPY